MQPADLLRALHDADVAVRLHEGRLQVYPAERLTARLRAAIREHRAGLVALLAQTDQTTVDLLAAAMRVCDIYGEGAGARAAMQADCLTTPPHLRADLLEYFDSLTRLHEQAQGCEHAFTVDFETSGFSYGEAANQDRHSVSFDQTDHAT